MVSVREQCLHAYHIPATKHVLSVVTTTARCFLLLNMLTMALLTMALLTLAMLTLAILNSVAILLRLY